MTIPQDRRAQLRRPAAALAAAVAAATALAFAGTTGPANAAPTGAEPVVTPRSAPTKQTSDTAERALVRATGVSAATAKKRVKGEAALATRSAKVDAALSPSSSAGSWLDQKSGRLVVAVTTDAAATTARDLGATPRKVAYSTAQLRTVQRGLDTFAAGRGAGKVQSWGIDPASNTVTVRTTAGTDATTRAFVARAKTYGTKAKVVTSTARVQTMADLVGGQQIEFTGYVCSNGFNARTSGGAARMLTAGHCGEGYSTFSSGGTTIGKTTAFSFPGNDYAQAPVSSAWTPRGVVDTYDGGWVAVEGSTAAAVGATICKSGRTTGWTCGTVQAKNQTVNYSNEDGTTSTVSGLTETSTCTEGGDSGGSNMSGNQAQGLTSGGAGYGSSGVCGEKVGQPNVSYIQPVNEALSAYGLNLITE